MGGDHRPCPFHNETVVADRTANLDGLTDQIGWHRIADGAVFEQRDVAVHPPHCNIGGVESAGGQRPQQTLFGLEPHRRRHPRRPMPNLMDPPLHPYAGPTVQLV